MRPKQGTQGRADQGIVAGGLGRGDDVGLEDVLGGTAWGGRMEVGRGGGESGPSSDCTSSAVAGRPRPGTTALTAFHGAQGDERRESGTTTSFHSGTSRRVRWAAMRTRRGAWTSAAPAKPSDDTISPANPRDVSAPPMAPREAAVRTAARTARPSPYIWVAPATSRARKRRVAPRPRRVGSPGVDARVARRWVLRRNRAFGLPLVFALNKGASLPFIPGLTPARRHPQATARAEPSPTGTQRRRVCSRQMGHCQRSRAGRPPKDSLARHRPVESRDFAQTLAVRSS